MTRRVSRLDILEYALEGAVTRRGVGSGHLSEEHMEKLAKDIAELERRIAKEEAKRASLNPKEIR